MRKGAATTAIPKLIERLHEGPGEEGEPEQQDGGPVHQRNQTILMIPTRPTTMMTPRSAGGGRRRPTVRPEEAADQGADAR